MTHTDFPELSKIIYMLGALYNQPVNEMLLQIWAQSLSEYDIADISMSATRWVKNTDGGQFMPKPADIIRLLEGSTGTRATEAWNRVMAALGAVGTYHTVDFQDPAIHYAITEMGGWNDFGIWENSETPFKQKRFEDLYRAYLTAPRGTPPLELAGRSDAINRNTGFEKWIEGAVKVPQLEGRKKQCVVIPISGGGK